MSPLLQRIFLSRRFAILALLLVAIGSVTVGLASAPRLHDAAPWLLNAALSSVLLGWLLAASPLPGHVGLPIGIVIGAVWAFVSGGRLAPGLINWLSKFPPLLPQVLRYWRDGTPQPDWQPLIIAGQLLTTSTNGAWQRLTAWAADIGQKLPANDAMPLAMFWIGVLWLLALWAGWATQRTRNPLLALSPAVGLLAALLNYQGLETQSLVAPLGALMLLMALLRYDRREQQWMQQRIDFAEGISIDVMLTTSALVAGLLAVGLLAPSFSVQKITDFARQFNRSESAAPMGEAFGLKAKPTVIARTMRPQGLAQDHILGGRPNLTSDVVMTVEISQPRYTPPPDYLLGLNYFPAAPRYYWRILTYDQYTGFSWRSSPVNTLRYTVKDSIFAEIPTSQQLIRQKITPIQKLNGVLIVTGQLQSASRPYDADWRQASDSFTQADLFGAKITDGVYEATSYIPQVTAAQLRAAPSTYPAEISQRYLQLPENLPIRVRELALKLTADQPTPYDKAFAIEQFLRTIPYSLDISAPPRGRDGVDYFLFDLQTGFCDYYASAMTVLARAAGLPARLVLGYASGSYNGPYQRYDVRQTDSHAWVEIYFPEVGWVEFEPTAAQPAIIRPDDDGKPVVLPAVELPKPENQPIAGLAGWLKNSAPLAFISLICLGALAVQGAFAWRVIEGWWWSRQPPERAIINIYRRMRRGGENLLGPLPTGDTPDEFANRLEAWLKDARFSIGFTYLQRKMAPAGEEITQLTCCYTQAVYSNHAISQEIHTTMWHNWRKLRGRLWLAGLVQRNRRWLIKARKSP